MSKNRNRNNGGNNNGNKRNDEAKHGVMRIIDTLTDKKKLKKMSKDERTTYVYEAVEPITNFYVYNKMREKEVISQLFDMMANPKIVKQLKKIVKTADGDYAITARFALVIIDFLKDKAGDLDADIVEEYTAILNTILKPTIKKLKKETNLPETYCLELAACIPCKDVVSRGQYIGKYILELQRKIYSLAVSEEFKDIEISDKILNKIMKVLVDKQYKTDVLSSISLDRKTMSGKLNEKQLKLWSLFTTYLLENLNSMDKKDIREFIAKYLEIRDKDDKNKNDSARRTIFSQVNESEYPAIKKVCVKLAERDEAGAYKRFL